MTSRPADTVLMWSGGKDAALALGALRQDAAHAVQALLTTVLDETETVTMHGVPLALIRAQAEALALPLHVMRIPPAASNTTYEAQLERALGPLLAQGITVVAAGDLLLDDVRAYREALLRRIGAAAHFPLWGRDTTSLAHHVLDAGVRAVVASVDTTQLDAAFAGRPYDAAFLDDLPAAVDPCGEDGAFHTFVTDGPGFAQPVPVRVVEQHGRGRMRYARLALDAPPAE